MSTAPPSTAPPSTEAPAPAKKGKRISPTGIRRSLLLRDSVTFLGLTLLTVVLFMATLFLFRSFSAHRRELAVRWADRGRADLADNRPEGAIVSLRTALTYAPDERPYELLLAQALGEAGHIEESWNYFTGLWDRQPGDGFINLSLARLAAAKGETGQAVNFYRAAVYGTWNGDGIARRSSVRLELARYLMDHHELQQARTELVVAGGNAQRNPASEMAIAGLLEQAGDPRDALDYYRRAAGDDPHSISALTNAARISFALGNFGEARRSLDRALRVAEAARPLDPSEVARLKSQQAQVERVLALSPSPALSSRERVARLLTDLPIARARLASCLGSPGIAISPQLAAISGRWSTAEPLINRGWLLADGSRQDDAAQLIFDTEVATAKSCGAPSGDDALLLRLAEQEAAAAAQQNQTDQP